MWYIIFVTPWQLMCDTFRLNSNRGFISLIGQHHFRSRTLLVNLHNACAFSIPLHSDRNRELVLNSSEPFSHSKSWARQPVLHNSSAREWYLRTYVSVCLCVPKLLVPCLFTSLLGLCSIRTRNLAHQWHSKETTTFKPCIFTCSVFSYCANCRIYVPVRKSEQQWKRITQHVQ